MDVRVVHVPIKRIVWPLVAVMILAFAALVPTRAQATSLTLCGNSGSAAGPIQHVMIVMLENRSYNTVVGGTGAPYESGTLAKQCGVASNMYGATHWSAANYMALSGGQYSQSGLTGCGSVPPCTNSGYGSLFAQADAAGLGWHNYVEGGTASPPSCSQTKSSAVTKIGHEPGLFYGLADCPANMIPVPDMTAQSGPLWTDLQNRTLSAVSWISPTINDTGEGPGGLAASDAWLKAFLATIQQSATYQDGRTAVVVTYDEGAGGGDAVVGEDCTNQALDLAGKQNTCHIPFFMVYPYTQPGTDTGFFDHYSVTKTVEDLFGWSYLAHAADSQTASLVGHFGLQAPSSFPTSSPSTSTTSSSSTTTDSPSTTTDPTTDSPTSTDSPSTTDSPSSTSTTPPPDTTPPTIPGNLQANADPVLPQVNVSWTASSDDTGVAGYELDRSIDNVNWTTVVAAGSGVAYEDDGLDPGTLYYYRVRAFDAAGNQSDFASTSVTTAAAATSTSTTTSPSSTDTGSPTSSTSPPPTWVPLTSTCGNAAPQINMPTHHLIVLFMENQSRSAVVGNAKAPYQSQLATQCGQATNMYNVSHPSLPNYLAANSGNQPLSPARDCVPNLKTAGCTSPDDNVFHQLTASGQSWRGYAENMTSNCEVTNDGEYAARHNPPVYFTDLKVNLGSTSDCGANDLPMGDISTQTGQFYSDLRSGNLPAYTFIAPNLIDDAHDSNVQTGDAYLAKLIPLIVAGPNYQAGDTTIVITYDEGGGTDKTTGEDCTNQALDMAGSQPSCNIPFVVVSPYEAAGTVSSAFCTLYCLTKTIENTFGLPLLGHAADAGTRDLSADFNLSPVGTGVGGSSGTSSTTSSSSSSSSSTTTGPPAPHQYVTNPGVEGTQVGWTGVYSSNSTVSLVQIPGGSHDGLWAVKSTNSGKSTAAAGLANKKPLWVDGTTVATTAGTTYTASVWVNGASGLKASIHLKECAPGGTNCGSPATATVTLQPATWTQISVPFKATKSGDSLMVTVSGAALAPGASFLSDTFSLTSPGS